MHPLATLPPHQLNPKSLKTVPLSIDRELPPLTSCTEAKAIDCFANNNLRIYCHNVQGLSGDDKTQVWIVWIMDIQNLEACIVQETQIARDFVKILPKGMAMADSSWSRSTAKRTQRWSSNHSIAKPCRRMEKGLCRLEI